MMRVIHLFKLSDVSHVLDNTLDAEFSAEQESKVPVLVGSIF